MILLAAVSLHAIRGPRGCLELSVVLFQLCGWPMAARKITRRNTENMIQEKARPKRPKNNRQLVAAEKSERSLNLPTKLDTLARSDGAALDNLAPAFYDRFIEAALARITSEEYGVCMDCGNAISRGRLEAIPWARRCIGCQELVNDASFANDSAQLKEMST